MSDDHRRIEPRPGIPGTGMLSDPDRIAEIERRTARFDRDTSPRPKRGFGEVIGKSKEKRRREAEEEPPSEEERQAKEAEAEAERQSIRKLMGRGSVHPNHHGRHGRVALKG